MTSDRENREWLNDCTSLKQVNSDNPFIVPVGYFDGLGARIMNGVKLDALKNSMPLSGFTVTENYFEELSNNIKSRVSIESALAGDSGFTVPENYFEELNGNINSRINIDSALAADTGFTLPENYFEELNSQVNSRVFVEEALNADTGFMLPGNYFERLSDEINSRIFVEEALAASADTFAVPQDYFNKLNKRILDETVNKDTRKRQGVMVRMFSSVAFKYATAACLALMVGTGIFVKQYNNPVAVHNRSYLHKTLASVPVDEIQSYLQSNVDGNDLEQTALSEGAPLNDADLDNALQNHSDTQ